MERVPEIRFAGFDGEWEEKKLGELGSLKNGMNFSKDAMNKGYPFVNLNNIFGKNTIDTKNLGKAEASKEQLQEYNLVKGDVLFVRSSVKLEGVGEAALVSKTLKNTTYSGFIIRFRDQVGIDNNFKRFVFLTKHIRDRILSQATDSANKNISQPVLRNLNVFLPCYEEQSQVGDYFSTLDSLITSHQRTCDDLKELKKCMLRKMFPRKGEKVSEIRFAGFEGAWKEKKLGEIANKVKTKNQDNSITETFTNSAEFGIMNQLDYFDHEITNTENISNYYIVENNDFVYNPRISTLAPVGPVRRNNLGRSGVMSPLYTVFRTHDINQTYLEWYFKSDHWYGFMYFNGDSGARSDRFSIKDTVFFDMPIPIPSVDEQTKIADYFSTLDSMITNHQQLTEDLKQVKKYMLQNMFPQG